jgi:2'-5' RNA ligase
MKETIRTFIAIKIIPEKKLTELFLHLHNSLKGEEIKWVDINNLHLTLRFLGETNREQISETIKVLESIASHFNSFQIEIKGVGVFKNKMQPRVLFLSVVNNLILKKLADEIREKLNFIGFDEDEKTFNPHLTLGRIKYIENKDTFYVLANRFSDEKIQSFTVSEITFYQSILSSAGPTYKPIKIVKLNQ